MGQNSHNPTINEDAKPWSSKVTVERYDFATLSRRAFVKKYGQEKYDQFASGQ